MRPRFYIQELTPNSPNLTEMIRENFKRLDLYLKTEPMLNGQFRHCELTLDRALTDFKFQHRLTFTPTDIVQTFLTEGVTITWAYDHFDATNIQFTTSAACTFRFFVGRYLNETGVS